MKQTTAKHIHKENHCVSWDQKKLKYIQESSLDNDFFLQITYTEQVLQITSFPCQDNRESV